MLDVHHPKTPGGVVTRAVERGEHGRAEYRVVTTLQLSPTAAAHTTAVPCAVAAVAGWRGLRSHSGWAQQQQHTSCGAHIIDIILLHHNNHIHDKN